MNVAVPDRVLAPKPTALPTDCARSCWLNRICAIASGSLATNARTLEVFQVV